MYDEIAGSILEYEAGTLTAEETLALFASLVKTGLAWQLQGHYGRLASAMIDEGLLTPDGEVR